MLLLKSAQVIRILSFFMSGKYLLDGIQTCGPRVPAHDNRGMSMSDWVHMHAHIGSKDPNPSEQIFQN